MAALLETGRAPTYAELGFEVGSGLAFLGAASLTPFALAADWIYGDPAETPFQDTLWWPYQNFSARWNASPPPTVNIRDYAAYQFRQGPLPPAQSHAKFLRQLEYELRGMQWLDEPTDDSFKYYAVTFTVCLDGVFTSAIGRLMRYLCSCARGNVDRVEFKVHECVYDQAISLAIQTAGEQKSDSAVGSLNVTARMNFAIRDLLNDPQRPGVPRDYGTDRSFHRITGMLVYVGYITGTLQLVKESQAMLDRHTRSDPNRNPAVDDDPHKASPERISVAPNKVIREGVVYAVRDDKRESDERDVYTTVMRTSNMSGVTMPYKQDARNEISALSRHAQVPLKKTADGLKLKTMAWELMTQYYVRAAEAMIQDGLRFEYDGTVKLPRKWSQRTVDAAWATSPESLPLGIQEGMVKSLEQGLPTNKCARGLAYVKSPTTANAAMAIQIPETVWLWAMGNTSEEAETAGRRVYDAVHVKHLDNDQRIFEIGEWLSHGCEKRSVGLSSDYSAFDSSIDCWDKEQEIKFDIAIIKHVLDKGLNLPRHAIQALQVGGVGEYQWDLQPEFGADNVRPQPDRLTMLTPPRKGVIQWRMREVVVTIDTQQVWRFSGERGTSFHNFVQNQSDWLALVIEKGGLDYARKALERNPEVFAVCAMRGEGDDRGARMPKAWYPGSYEQAARAYEKDHEKFGRVLEAVAHRPQCMEFVSWHFYQDLSTERRHRAFPKPVKAFENSQVQACVAAKLKINQETGEPTWDDSLHAMAASSLCAYAYDSKYNPIVSGWTLAFARMHAAMLTEDAAVEYDHRLEREVLYGCVVGTQHETVQAYVDEMEAVLGGFPIDDWGVNIVTEALYWGKKVPVPEWESAKQAVRSLAEALSQYQATESDWRSGYDVSLKLPFGPLKKFFAPRDFRNGQASDVPGRSVSTVLHPPPRVPLVNSKGKGCERGKGAAGSGSSSSGGPGPGAGGTGASSSGSNSAPPPSSAQPSTAERKGPSGGTAPTGVSGSGAKDRPAKGVARGGRPPKSGEQTRGEDAQGAAGAGAPGSETVPMATGTTSASRARRAAPAGSQRQRGQKGGGRWVATATSSA